MTDPEQSETVAAEPPKVPALASVWEDAGGRVLTVDEVRVGDPLGREVVGRIFSSRGEGGDGQAFATTLVLWAHYWRDRQRPVPIEDLEYR